MLDDFHFFDVVFEIHQHWLHIPAGIVGRKGGKGVSLMSFEVFALTVAHDGIETHFRRFAGKQRCRVDLQRRRYAVQVGYGNFNISVFIVAVQIFPDAGEIGDFRRRHVQNFPEFAHA